MRLYVEPSFILYSAHFVFLKVKKKLNIYLINCYFNKK